MAAVPRCGTALPTIRNIAFFWYQAAKSGSDVVIKSLVRRTHPARQDVCAIRYQASANAAAGRVRHAAGMVEYLEWAAWTA